MKNLNYISNKIFSIFCNPEVSIKKGSIESIQNLVTKSIKNRPKSFEQQNKVFKLKKIYIRYQDFKKFQTNSRNKSEH